MGKTHALSGLAAGVATLPAVIAALHPGPAGIALYLVGCTGAALLPDIDHPDASVSRSFGVCTQVFAWAVAHMAGGHRHGTHSYYGAGVFTLIAATGCALTTGRPAIFAWGAAAAVALTAAGAAFGAADRARGIDKTPRRGGDATVATVARGTVAAVLACTVAVCTVRWPHTTGLTLAATVLILTMAAANRPLKIAGYWDDLAPIPITWWLLAHHPASWGVLGAPVDLAVVPAAVAVGALTHIVGDQMTHGGCPIGWPLSRRDVRITLFGGTFRTGGPVERGPVTWTLWAAVVIVGGVQLAATGPAIDAWHHVAAAWAQR